MTRKLETWLDAVLCRSPAQPLFLWRAEDRLTVLAYHGVDDPARFEQQLDYLTRVMHPVTLEEVAAALAGRRGLPKRAALVTFDDGDRSLVDVAMPLLRARGVPAIAFVIAGLIDTNRAPWWIDVEHLVNNGGVANGLAGRAAREIVQALKKVPDHERMVVLDELKRTAKTPTPALLQLRREDLLELETAGVTIGNHTFTHPCLNRCADEKVLSELSQAHRRLTMLMGKAPRSFAYPNGDADERATNALATMEYEAGFLFDHKVSQLPLSNRFKISRVRVNSNTSLDRFRIIVTGLHPALHRTRGGV